MPERKIRGVRERQDRGLQEHLRDTRPLSTIILEKLASRELATSLVALLALLIPVFPAATPIWLLLALFFFLLRRASVRYAHLPFRLPLGACRTDYGDEKPGGGYGKGDGVFYLGVDRESGEELWLKRQDLLTHALVLGTTGAGKTVTLTAISFNVLAMGGGLIYTDPKAAPALWRNFHVIARLLLRDSDLRVVNYMTANARSTDEGPVRLTNTLNPFAHGNADSLTQLLVSLIEVSQGDNAVFGQNAQMAVAALMLGLVELRDQGLIELSVKTVRDNFNIRGFISLAESPNLKPSTRDSIKAFLSSMGYQEGVPFDRQPRSLPEQFQYARAYFGMALNSLNDTYGHIYRKSMGEVDPYDVIRNRRILINMLPSLEKAPAELAQLGKVTLSSVRNAIAIGLGRGLEGSIDDVTESLPLRSPTPMMVLTDEYAAIPTPGYAEIMTQGRGLGIASVTASQDLDGIARADEAGAGQIVENTKVKLGMKISGAGKTWDLYKGLADEAWVMQSQGAAVGGRFAERGNLSFGYMDQQNASLSKVSRLDLLDFQEQIEGEFHAFFNGKIVRGSSFFDPLFDDPKSAFGDARAFGAYDLRINRLLCVQEPSEQELQMRYGDKRALLDALVLMGKEERWPSAEEPRADPAMAELIAFLAERQGGQLSLMDATIVGLLRWDQGVSAQAEDAVASLEKSLGLALGDEPETAATEPESAEPDALDADDLSSFLPEVDTKPEPEPAASAQAAPEAVSDDEDAEAEDDLDYASVIDWSSEEGLDRLQDDLEEAEKGLGNSPEEARAVAHASRKGLERAMRYPRPPKPEPIKTRSQREALMESINQFID